MIIKIIPETPEEKLRAKEVVHIGVKDFFFCGNKQAVHQEDSDVTDFHDWRGTYKFLEGSLLYYNNIIKEERHGKERASKEREIELTPPLPTLSPESKETENQVTFIKTGEATDIQIIDTEPMKGKVMGREINFSLAKEESQEAQENQETQEVQEVQEVQKPEAQAIEKCEDFNRVNLAGQLASLMQ